MAAEHSVLTKWSENNVEKREMVESELIYGHQEWLEIRAMM